jgi:hypothetical protein
LGREERLNGPTRFGWPEEKKEMTERQEYVYLWVLFAVMLIGLLIWAVQP